MKSTRYIVMTAAVVVSLLTAVHGAAPVFTGDAEADFNVPNAVTVSSPTDLWVDKGAGIRSGYDIKDVRFYYDPGSETTEDVLYVGINTWGIAGDADGDGDPGSAAAGSAIWDSPDFGGGESFYIALDLNPVSDPGYDINTGVGVHSSLDVAPFSGFRSAEYGYPATSESPYFCDEIPACTGELFASPSSTQPDLLFTIRNLRSVAGLTLNDILAAGGLSVKFRVSVGNFAGSDGIGEDRLTAVVDLPVDTGGASSGSLAGFVFNDLNADGFYDQNTELGFGGILVEATYLAGPDGRPTPISILTVTFSDGYYSFPGLPPNTYTVSAIDGVAPLASLVQTAPRLGTSYTVTLGGSLIDGLDFGYADVANCGECLARVTWMTLRYTGGTAATVEVVQNKNIDLPNGVDTVFGPTTVNPGEAFRFNGTWNNGTLGTAVLVYVGEPRTLNTQIHTSCSIPVGPGEVFGDFVVVAGASLKGGLLCPEEVNIANALAGSTVEEPAANPPAKGKKNK